MNNPYEADVLEVFSERPPHPFVMDSEYNPGNGHLNFVIYADNWHAMPDSAIISCSEYLNRKLTELSKRGVPVTLEKRDAVL